MAANRQTDRHTYIHTYIHMHVRNAVTLVWGSLRLVPITYDCNSNTAPPHTTLLPYKVKGLWKTGHVEILDHTQ